MRINQTEYFNIVNNITLKYLASETLEDKLNLNTALQLIQSAENIGDMTRRYRLIRSAVRISKLSKEESSEANN